MDDLKSRVDNLKSKVDGPFHMDEEGSLLIWFGSRPSTFEQIKLPNFLCKAEHPMTITIF